MDENVELKEVLWYTESRESQECDNMYAEPGLSVNGSFQWNREGG